MSVGMMFPVISCLPTFGCSFASASVRVRICVYVFLFVSYVPRGFGGFQAIEIVSFEEP